MGNTSSVTIPLALDLAIKEGKLNNGDTLLLYGFGGGLTFRAYCRVEFNLSVKRALVSN